MSTGDGVTKGSSRWALAKSVSQDTCSPGWTFTLRRPKTQHGTEQTEATVEGRSTLASLRCSLESSCEKKIDGYKYFLKTDVENRCPILRRVGKGVWGLSGLCCERTNSWVQKLTSPIPLIWFSVESSLVKFKTQTATQDHLLQTQNSLCLRNEWWTTAKFN